MQLIRMVIEKGGRDHLGGTALSYGFVLTAYFEYLLLPSTLLLLLVSAEGAARLMAAVSNESVLASFLVAIPYRLWRTILRKRTAENAGDTFIDLDKSGKPCRIYVSASDKEWDDRLSLSYHGEFFEIHGRAKQVGPRNVFTLRPVPKHKITRKILTWSEAENRFL